MPKTYFLLLILVFSSLVACSPRTPCFAPVNSIIETSLTSDYADLDGEIISNVRIRGYILPAETLTTVIAALEVSPGIIGNNQKYLHQEVYDMFVNGFSDMLKNGYDHNLLATYPVQQYQSGAEITFDVNNYIAVIDGISVNIPTNTTTAAGAKTRNLLTADKKWRLNDISWLAMTSGEFAPRVGDQYYILWMLEGYIWSNQRHKMIVRIIGEDLRHLSLYTVVD